MKAMKKELLAAVAAAALIATGGTLSAQEQTKPGGTNAEAMGGAKTGGTQVQTQGGAQMKSGQSGMQTESGAKTRAQTQSGQNQPGAAGEKVGAQPGGPGNRAPGQAEGSGEPKTSTQVQSGSEKPAQLSSEQRTKISSTLRSSDVNLKRVERTNINFSINVGTVVPRTIGLVPLPAPIVAVVPAYRGYLHIVVGDELLIVHPRTYEIVAVIPA